MQYFHIRGTCPEDFAKRDFDRDKSMCVEKFALISLRFRFVSFWCLFESIFFVSVQVCSIFFFELTTFMKLTKNNKSLPVFSVKCVFHSMKMGITAHSAEVLKSKHSEMYCMSHTIQFVAEVLFSDLDTFCVL